MPIRRIVIVEDNEKYRRSLCNVFERAGYRVVGEAGDGKTGAEIALREQPDVVLMDVEMPVMNGVESARVIRRISQKIEVVILTVLDNKTVFEALKAGASGYILKETPLREIVAGVEQALAGGSPISPRVARLVFSAFGDSGEAREVASDTARETIENLTEREREILSLLVQGETSASLAEKLNISLHTANAHIRNIYRKLEVSSRAQAVGRALREHLA